MKTGQIDKIEIENRELKEKLPSSSMTVKFAGPQTVRGLDGLKLKTKLSAFDINERINSWRKAGFPEEIIRKSLSVSLFIF